MTSREQMLRHRCVRNAQADNSDFHSHFFHGVFVAERFGNQYEAEKDAERQQQAMKQGRKD